MNRMDENMEDGVTDVWRSVGDDSFHNVRGILILRKLNKIW